MSGYLCTRPYTADNPTGAFVLQNTATGLQVFTQAFAFDPLSSFGIQFTASNGRESTVPAVGAAQVNQVTRLWNNAGGTTAAMAFFSPTTMVGYGLATQFTF